MLKIEQISMLEAAVLKVDRPYAVLLVTSGEGFLKVNVTRVALKAGRVFFLRGYQTITIEGTLRAGHLTGFQTLLLHSFLFQFVAHRNKGLFDPGHNLPYSDLDEEGLDFSLHVIRRLKREIERGTSATIFMHHLFLLLRDVNRQVEDTEPLLPEREIKLLKMTTLIEENYNAERKTSFYADRLGMSERQLNDLTKELFEKRFFAVLMEHIMLEADRLLMDKSIRIKDIAYGLGFSSESHFSGSYSKEKGYSPSVFRNRL